MRTSVQLSGMVLLIKLANRMQELVKIFPLYWVDRMSQ